MGTRVSYIDSRRILGRGGGVAFARRRVATAEYTFRLLHSVAFDQQRYANVISATSLSSTFCIGGLMIDIVFLAAYRRRVPRAIISPSRTISPLDATFLFPFDYFALFNCTTAFWSCAICSSVRKCHFNCSYLFVLVSYARVNILVIFVKNLCVHDKFYRYFEIDILKKKTLFLYVCINRI